VCRRERRVGDGGQVATLRFDAGALLWRYEARYGFEFNDDSWGSRCPWRRCIPGLSAHERGAGGYREPVALSETYTHPELTDNLRLYV